MKHKSILAAAVACWGLACTGLPVPVAGNAIMSTAYADGRRAVVHPRGKRVARTRGYVRRGGYYSYTRRDVINTLLWPPFRFSSISPVDDPWTYRQSLGGPFDSGFWFDSGIGPPWNNAPYPR